MPKYLPLLLLLLLTSPASATDWGPWEQSPAKRQQNASDRRAPLQVAVRFFQRYISPVDGPRCPMYPTCSAYSLQALRKHGPTLGTFLTVDRLYREGDRRHEHEQPINKLGRVRFFDPLDDNDFWVKLPLKLR